MSYLSYLPNDWYEVTTGIIPSPFSNISLLARYSCHLSKSSAYQGVMPFIYLKKQRNMYTHFEHIRSPLKLSAFYLAVAAFLLGLSFQGQAQIPSSTLKEIETRLEAFNQLKIDAARSQSFEIIQHLYQSDALLYAEYHPLIEGVSKIRQYYTTIYSRQELQDYSRTIHEIIPFEDRVIEIGFFRKVFSDGGVHRGKFMHIWVIGDNGDFRLRAEVFGYHHQIEDPSALVVESLKDTSTPLSPREGVLIPQELQARIRRNEGAVIARKPERSAALYTEDGGYFPFADTLKLGRENLLKHYQAYYRNPATIDSIRVWAYDYDEVADGYIRYTKFYVDWTVPNYSGNTQGGGIAYMRREKDGSLKTHRQVGTHIHQE